MKVFFESMLNQWYFPATVGEKKTRAYLDVYFIESKKEALQKALAIENVLNMAEEIQEVPMGLLEDEIDDFRVCITDS